MQRVVKWCSLAIAGAILATLTGIGTTVSVHWLWKRTHPPHKVSAPIPTIAEQITSLQFALARRGERVAGRYPADLHGNGQTSQVVVTEPDNDKNASSDRVLIYDPVHGRLQLVFSFLPELLASRVYPVARSGKLGVAFSRQSGDPAVYVVTRVKLMDVDGDGSDELLFDLWETSPEGGDVSPFMVNWDAALHRYRLSALLDLPAAQLFLRNLKHSSILEWQRIGDASGSNPPMTTWTADDFEFVHPTNRPVLAIGLFFEYNEGKFHLYEQPFGWAIDLLNDDRAYALGCTPTRQQLADANLLSAVLGPVKSTEDAC